MGLSIVLKRSSVLVLGLIRILVLNLDRVVAPILLLIDLEISLRIKVSLGSGGVCGFLNRVVVGDLRDLAYVLFWGSIILRGDASVV